MSAARAVTLCGAAFPRFTEAMAPRDFVLLMLVCLVWATNFVVTKLAVTVLHMPPLFLSALRFLIVFIAVSPWLLPWPRPRWRIVLVGVMMGAGGFGLVSVGLLYATPSSAAVVGQLGVPITALLSVAMLGGFGQSGGGSGPGRTQIGSGHDRSSC